MRFRSEVLNSELDKPGSGFVIRMVLNLKTLFILKKNGNKSILASNANDASKKRKWRSGENTTICFDPTVAWENGH
jgi:hypothetical protein